MAEITYRLDCEGVDWVAMKAAVTADNFDNGRSPAQLEASFRNSAVPVIAYADDRIIGTARALSDGVCNAYVVDVWTDSAYRNQGAGADNAQPDVRKIARPACFLWTDDAQEFYKKVGFRQRDCAGFETVVGKWLVG